MSVNKQTTTTTVIDVDKSGRDLLEPIGNARRKQHDQVLCQF